MASSPQDEEETFANAMQMALGIVFPKTMKAAMELGLFNIIATAGGSGLSVDEICAQLSGCTNTEAPKMVERILRLLISHDLISCSVGDNGKRLYSLTSVAKYFVPDEDGVSLGPVMALAQDTVYFPICLDRPHLKGAVLNGAIPFNMSHGMHLFEYAATDPRFDQEWNIWPVICLKRFQEEMQFYMKWIIHDWDDDHYLRLLKNCHKAIPKTGKVIVMDQMIPEVPNANFAVQDKSHMDVLMMTLFSGGKERTRREFEALAVESGFSDVRFVCTVRNIWIMEFFK